MSRKARETDTGMNGGSQPRSAPANPYEGTVVHRCRDAGGEIVVADSALTRTLYFGKSTKQSSIFLGEPAVPAMYYMRAMMSALVFRPRPRRVLLIGLGGGAVVNFLLRACPESSIEAVEIRGEVIRVAHEYFALPRDHPRLRIIHGDGREYLLRNPEATPERYDHIFVDAFDGRGPAAAVTARDFLLACRRSMNRQGVLTFDLWTGEESGYERHREQVAEVFRGAIRELVLQDAEGNAVLFAFMNRDCLKQGERWRRAAAQLQAAYSINFLKFLDQLESRS